MGNVMKNTSSEDPVPFCLVIMIVLNENKNSSKKKTWKGKIDNIL